MRIETTNFGTIDIKEDKVITFVNGILGFENYSKFTIINDLENDNFYWLQSLEEASLSFIMINPARFIDDYQISITDKFQKKLNLINKDDIVVYNLVVIGHKGSYVTTNLKAPIIINAKNKKAGQLILEKDYPTRHYLFQEENGEISS